MKKKTRLMIGILCCAAALGEVWNVLHIISTRAGTPLLAPWLAGAALGFIIFTSVAVVMFRAAARINAKETGSIGIGSPIAEAPSHTTGLTDRVSGGSAVSGQ